MFLENSGILKATINKDQKLNIKNVADVPSFLQEKWF